MKSTDYSGSSKPAREERHRHLYLPPAGRNIRDRGHVTVMRDGKHIATKPVAEVQNRSELIKMMIGKAVFEQYVPRESECPEHPRSQAPLQRETERHLLQREARGDRRFLWAGRRRQDRTGAGDLRRGRVRRRDPFQGQEAPPDAGQTIAAGIALVPEERRSQGLFPILTIRDNIPVMNMGKISSGGFVDASAERNVTLNTSRS